MKKRLRLVILLVVLFRQTLPAQGKSWPPTYWADTSVFYGGKNLSPAQNLKGDMVLKNGDSLNGYLCINHRALFWRSNGCWLLQENENTPILIKPQKIRNIRVEAASFGSGFTDIFILPINNPKNAFWRLIAKKGAVAIYDKSMGIFSHESRWATWNKYRGLNIAADEFNDDMFMISNGVPIKIYGAFGFHRHRDRAAELILKFVKDRYHQSIKLTDFKTKMDMIDYVLREENTRLNAAHKS